MSSQYIILSAGCTIQIFDILDRWAFSLSFGWLKTNLNIWGSIIKVIISVIFILEITTLINKNHQDCFALSFNQMRMYIFVLLKILIYNQNESYCAIITGCGCWSLDDYFCVNVGRGIIITLGSALICAIFAFVSRILFPKKLIIIRYVNPDHSEPEELFRSNFEFGCQRFFNNIAKDGRTANNKQAVIQFSWTKSFSNFFIINESLEAFPAFLDWSINWEEAFKGGVLSLEGLKFRFDQNVVFSSICKKKGKVWSVSSLFGFSDILDYLVKGSYACSSADHKNVVHFALANFAITEFKEKYSSLIWNFDFPR